jgi:large subunit ribosomal protein L13
MDKKEFTIDATDQSLGRLATQVALLLRGKTSPSFERHLESGVKVHVTNAAKVKLTGKKFTDKYYKHYTGYPGGMRKQTVDRVVDKKGYEEIFRKAVYGMLPGNKLRPLMMKNLKISE